jgi:hypothetical protein
MAKQSSIKVEEKAILEIIKRYGDTINLKKSPYLIAEIIRQYASVFSPIAGGESGPVPGSHGTPPPPGPKDMFDPRKKIEEVTLALSKLSIKVRQLEKKVKG